MTTHLFRKATPDWKPVVNAHGTDSTGQDVPRSLYFVECDRCGVITYKGLSRRAAEAQAGAHRCTP